MKNLLKLKVIILILSVFFTSQTLAGNRILRVPKPIVDEDIKKETAKKKRNISSKKTSKKS